MTSFLRGTQPVPLCFALTARVMSLAYMFVSIMFCNTLTAADDIHAQNSNVVTFFSLLKKDNRNDQMVYYQVGLHHYLAL